MYGRRVLTAGAFLAALALAQPVSARAIPKLTGPVVDEAQVINAAARLEFDEMLRRFAANSGSQMQVLTVKSLQGENLEAFSMRVVDAWKLGKVDTDRGLLILVAVDDRQVRIEVGQGLEGQITDARAGQIIDRVMIPYFKKNDYTGGIRAGMQAVGSELGVDLGPINRPIRSQYPERIEQRPPIWFVFIFFMALLFFSFPGVLFWLFAGTLFGRRARGGFYRGDSSSGFSGGGFSSGGFFGGGGGWSGGGGGFSGGGSSGRW